MSENFNQTQGQSRSEYLTATCRFYPHFPSIGRGRNIGLFGIDRKYVWDLGDNCGEPLTKAEIITYRREVEAC